MKGPPKKVNGKYNKLRSRVVKILKQSFQFPLQRNSIRKPILKLSLDCLQSTTGGDCFVPDPRALAVKLPLIVNWSSERCGNTKRQEFGVGSIAWVWFRLDGSLLL